MKHNQRSRRRNRSRFPRCGIIHASAGIANVLASLYFALAGGTAEQQNAAEEFKAMVLDMGKVAS